MSVDNVGIDGRIYLYVKQYIDLVKSVILLFKRKGL